MNHYALFGAIAGLAYAMDQGGSKTRAVAYGAIAGVLYDVMFDRVFAPPTTTLVMSRSLPNCGAWY